MINKERQKAISEKFVSVADFLLPYVNYSKLGVAGIALLDASAILGAGYFISSWRNGTSNLGLDPGIILGVSLGVRLIHKFDIGGKHGRN